VLVAKGFPEKVIVSKLFYGNEIAFPLGQKSSVALDGIGMGDAIV